MTLVNEGKFQNALSAMADRISAPDNFDDASRAGDAAVSGASVLAGINPANPFSLYQNIEKEFASLAGGLQQMSMAGLWGDMNTALRKSGVDVQLAVPQFNYANQNTGVRGGDDVGSNVPRFPNPQVVDEPKPEKPGKPKNDKTDPAKAEGAEKKAEEKPKTDAELYVADYAKRVDDFNASLSSGVTEEHAKKLEDLKKEFNESSAKLSSKSEITWKSSDGTEKKFIPTQENIDALQKEFSRAEEAYTKKLAESAQAQLGKIVESIPGLSELGASVVAAGSKVFNFLGLKSEAAPVDPVVEAASPPPAQPSKLAAAGKSAGEKGKVDQTAKAASKTNGEDKIAQAKAAAEAMMDGFDFDDQRTPLTKALNNFDARMRRFKENLKFRPLERGVGISFAALLKGRDAVKSSPSDEVPIMVEYYAERYAAAQERNARKDKIEDEINSARNAWAEKLKEEMNAIKADGAIAKNDPRVQKFDKAIKQFQNATESKDSIFPPGSYGVVAEWSNFKEGVLAM